MDQMANVLSGAAAGLAATVPMTAAMEAMHRLLPEHERHPLPPRQIVDNTVDQSPAAGALDEDEREKTALAAHFAFGAAAGAVYGMFSTRWCRRHPFLSGVSYGLTVWATQYLGVLPSVGVLSSAEHHPPRRNALMIAAHVVWGAALGAMLARDPRDHDRWWDEASSSYRPSDDGGTIPLARM
jgi:uncharacterized membrane protein YagU involved in acid resistance